RPYSTMPAPRSGAVASRSCNRARRTRMLIGRAPSADLKRRRAGAGLASQRRLFNRLCLRRVEAAVRWRTWLAALLQRAVDRGELRRDAGPEGLHGHDGDHGDESEEQAVLDHAGTGLVVGVELG